MKQLTRLFFVIAFVIALLTAGLSSVASAESQPRVTKSIDENNLVRLYRNTRPEANSKNDRGAVSDDLLMDHVLLLLQRSPEQEQELVTLIDSLNDRTSPNFHKWLTPEQYGEYGVAQEDIDKVTGWLLSFAKTRSCRGH